MVKLDKVSPILLLSAPYEKKPSWVLKARILFRRVIPEVFSFTVTNNNSNCNFKMMAI